MSARYKRIVILAVILLTVMLWQAWPRSNDIHAELRHRLIEAELGSAVYFHFASPEKMPDASKASFSDLLVQLRSTLPDLRWDAADALSDRGDPRAVDALILAMRDPSGTRRVCVMAKALGRLKDPRAVGPLTEAMFDKGNEDLRVCAIQSLGMIGDARAVPQLIAALEQRIMPTEAAKSLSRLGGDAAVDAIMRAAEDPALRFWMIPSLGESGSARALPFLARHQNDPAPAIRDAVAEAQWKISVLTQADPATALGSVLAHDSNTFRRMWAAFRLGEIHSPAAIPVLIRALSDPDMIVRGRAAATLVRTGPAALPAVRLAAQEQTNKVQAYAVAVLGYIGNLEDAATLEQLARHAPKMTASTALRSGHMIRQFDIYHREASSRPERG